MRRKLLGRIGAAVCVAGLLLLTPSVHAEEPPRPADAELLEQLAETFARLDAEQRGVVTYRRTERHRSGQEPWDEQSFESRLHFDGERVRLEEEEIDSGGQRGSAEVFVEDADVSISWQRGGRRSGVLYIDRTRRGSPGTRVLNPDQDVRPAYLYRIEGTPLADVFAGWAENPDRLETEVLEDGAVAIAWTTDSPYARRRTEVRLDLDQPNPRLLEWSVTFEEAESNWTRRKRYEWPDGEASYPKSVMSTSESTRHHLNGQPLAQATTSATEVHIEVTGFEPGVPLPDALVTLQSLEAPSGTTVVDRVANGRYRLDDGSETVEELREAAIAEREARRAEEQYGVPNAQQQAAPAEIPQELVIGIGLLVILLLAASVWWREAGKSRNRGSP